MVGNDCCIYNFVSSLVIYEAHNITLLSTKGPEKTYDNRLKNIDLDKLISITLGMICVPFGPN